MNLMDKITKREESTESAAKIENQQLMYTEEQLMARLRFFIGICLALTLTGIVFVVLYSIIFVTQPLNAISPIDQKFFELIIPIATFLTGTLSGIMLAGKDEKSKSPTTMSLPPMTPPATTPPVSSTMPIPPRPPMPSPMVPPPAPVPMPTNAEPSAPKLNALDLGIK